jgi:hypothetical protein
MWSTMSLETAKIILNGAFDSVLRQVVIHQLIFVQNRLTTRFIISNK